MLTTTTATTTTSTTTMTTSMTTTSTSPSDHTINHNGAGSGVEKSPPPSSKPTESAQATAPTWKRAQVAYERTDDWCHRTTARFFHAIAELPNTGAELALRAGDAAADLPAAWNKW